MQIKRLVYTNEVRSFREYAGMTQAQLGAAVGVSANSICSIENGSGCSIKTALKISVALATPVDFIFRLVDLSTGNFVVAPQFVPDSDFVPAPEVSE